MVPVNGFDVDGLPITVGKVEFAVFDESQRELYRETASGLSAEQRQEALGLLRKELGKMELTSWYLSNHPRSHFVTGLMAARPMPWGRYALRNNELTTYHRDGQTERRTLGGPAELKAVLEDAFGLLLPETPELIPALARLTGTPSRP